MSSFRKMAAVVACAALPLTQPALAREVRRPVASPNEACPCPVAAAAARSRSASGLRRAGLEETLDDAQPEATDGEDDAPLPLRRRLRRKPPPAPSAGPLYLLGGLGLAGVVGYGALVTWARDDNRRLTDCAPNCPASSVAHIRTLYLAADISLGVGLAALAATTWIYVGTRPPRREPGYSFRLRPLPGGALAGLGGAF